MSEDLTIRARAYSGMPNPVRRALEVLFDEPNIASIEVRFRPTYVRCHLFFLGAADGSVTRPERIYTSLPLERFFELDRHVLHEYYHVVQQWRRERMSRIGYLLRCRRREREAEAFVSANLTRYRRLKQAFADGGEAFSGQGRSGFSRDS